MRLAVVDELKDQVRHRVAVERLDWKAERATFISDKVSWRTRVVYDRALGLLEAWMAAHKLTPSDLTPREAGDFIRELRGRQGRDGKPPDADTVRLAHVHGLPPCPFQKVPIFPGFFEVRPFQRRKV